MPRDFLRRCAQQVTLLVQAHQIDKQQLQFRLKRPNFHISVPIRVQTEPRAVHFHPFFPWLRIHVRARFRVTFGGAFTMPVATCGRATKHSGHPG
jgi:hypothetical protein